MTKLKYPFFRKVIRNVAPPFLIAFYRLIFQKPVISFKYGFLTWESAADAAEGYEGDDIIEKTVTSARKVLNGEAIYERDSVIFEKIEYSWELLASLLFVAASKQSLKVIDFGGGLGTTYQQNRRFLQKLKQKVEWKIIEQARFVEIGKQEFTGNGLFFFDTITEASKSGLDVILFGSSICYVNNPYHFIMEAISTNVRYIIFDRTPISFTINDEFVLQKVSAPIYNASYPLRVFNRENILKIFYDNQFELVEEWECTIQSDRNSISMGFFLKKK
jgi:putative methyltransferase (TIGR04325 family)